MLFKGYLIGIVIVCSIFVIKILVRKNRDDQFKEKKRKDKSREKRSVFRIIISILAGVMGCIMGYLSEELYTENKLVYEYNTKIERYAEEIGDILQNADKSEQNTGLDDNFSIIRSEISELKVEMDKLNDDIEEQNETSFMKLFISFGGSMVIPIIIVILQIYSEEIKQKFKRKKVSEDANLGMIELRVEDYCQNCDEFEPVAEVMESHDIAMEDKECLTKVSCKHAHRCSELIKHLKKERK